MTSTTDIRTEVYVDPGPVWDAVRILAEQSTLRDHVNVVIKAGAAVCVEHAADDVPYELWGDGTKGLWRLVCAIAYTSESVSLYEVVSRLDRNNSRVVADAIGALCR